MKASELKVTDLMVGDWVSCNHLIGLKYFGKVNVDLLRIMQKQESGQIKEDSTLFRIVEPIPLTPEILEKNGFGGKKPKVELILEDKRELLYHINEKVLTIYWNCQIVFRSPCVYAHQLQHALRLCGINKEIVV